MRFAELPGAGGDKRGKAVGPSARSGAATLSPQRRQSSGASKRRPPRIPRRLPKRPNCLASTPSRWAPCRLLVVRVVTANLPSAIDSCVCPDSRDLPDSVGDEPSEQHLVDVGNSWGKNAGKAGRIIADARSARNFTGMSRAQLEFPKNFVECYTGSHLGSHGFAREFPRVVTCILVGL